MEARQARVLLVDDSRSDQVIVERAFEEGRINCSIDIVENGKAALEYLQVIDMTSPALYPDLILLDINMPVMDGKQTLQAIRADEKLKHLPVIMLTTSSHDRDVLESYQLGVNSYLTKPVNHIDFIDAIKNLEHFWLELVTLPKI